MNKKKPLFTYFGHHKCATQWICSIIDAVCCDLNFKFTRVNNHMMFDNKLDLFVKKNNIDFLAYTNANIHFVQDMNDFQGFHVIRDPRDIVVSAYFSHRYSHPVRKDWPALVEHREKLQNASQDEGLFLEMEFGKNEFRDLYDWDYSQKNVMEIKMEDMILSPYETMVSVFSHLKLVEDTQSLKRRLIHFFAMVNNKTNIRSKGLMPIRFSGGKIPVEILLWYVFQNRYSKLTKGRKQGEENIKSHYRNGVAGDWVNYFNKDHRHYFKENYNEILIKLGYETTSNW